MGKARFLRKIELFLASEGMVINSMYMVYIPKLHLFVGSGRASGAISAELDLPGDVRPKEDPEKDQGGLLGRFFKGRLAFSIPVVISQIILNGSLFLILFKNITCSQGLVVVGQV